MHSEHPKIATTDSKLSWTDFGIGHHNWITQPFKYSPDSNFKTRVYLLVSLTKRNAHSCRSWSAHCLYKKTEETFVKSNGKDCIYSCLLFSQHALSSCSQNVEPSLSRRMQTTNNLTFRKTKATRQSRSICGLFLGCCQRSVGKHNQMVAEQQP